MNFKNEKNRQIISIIVYLIFMMYIALTICNDLPGDCVNIMAKPSPDYGSWKSYAILFAPILICIAFVYNLLFIRTEDIVEVIYEFLMLIFLVGLLISVGLYKSYDSAGFQIICSAF